VIAAVPPISPRYRAAVAAALDCVHGQQGGDLVRPWTGTPACALCRRRHPVHWRLLDPEAPVPHNVIPIQGSRKLW
jgi:hypothetical protein